MTASAQLAAASLSPHCWMPHDGDMRFLRWATGHARCSSSPPLRHRKRLP